MKITELLLRPFQYFELLFSFITPRNMNKWCFGSSFTGNSKYLYIYMTENSEKKCIWIGKKDEVRHLRGLGLTAYTKHSFWGKIHLLTSGVYVFNSYVSNVSPYTWGRTKKVNLWHGVGLKNIEYKIHVGPIAKRYHSKGLINNLRYLNFRVKPDVFLSTSPMMTKHFSECFEIDESCILEGIYPRCVPLVQGKEYSLNFIIKYEGAECQKLINTISKYTFTYVFMPTFRDNGGDVLSVIGVDLKKINDALYDKNRLLILKLHPDSKINIHENYSNILLMDNTIDIYPVLSFTDCLITDYSSIYFDYILMKDKKVILYTPDYEDYIHSSRDLAFPYNEYTKGISTCSFDELLCLVKQPIEKYDMPDITSVRRAFWAPKFDNMSQLINAIEEKM